ncbi:hypothetical protein CGH70_23140 [Vibrio parahaemolyticus]|nr:hypothetical protein CGH70_23140 [Vibrio parahaemolyticus]
MNCRGCRYRPKKLCQAVSLNITKRSRGTWHAWHFRLAVGLVVKAQCGHFCIECLRPLTRRYINQMIRAQKEFL